MNYPQTAKTSFQPMIAETEFAQKAKNSRHVYVQSGEPAPVEGMYRLCLPDAQEILYLDEGWTAPLHENARCMWLLYRSSVS